MEDTPSILEITTAIRRLRNTAPGCSGLPAAAFKALLQGEFASSQLEAVVIELWETEVMQSAWEVGMLAVLPKKGDLSDPGNYRGIMMLEVSYKIVAIILHQRLSVLCESLDH